jgi:acyl-CoA synthetase (AMP-forming)/AMP-acid ligase II
MGEVGVAFAVAEDLTEEELLAWARERMANFKVPRHVLVVDELPRNPSMKVLKQRLRALWSERRPG